MESYFKHISTSFRANFSITSVRYAQCIAALLLESLLNIVLARHLNVDVYANVTLALRLINVLSILILLGTNDASAKSLRDLVIRNDQLEIGRYISWNLNYISKPLMISLILSFVFFFTHDPLDLFRWDYNFFHIQFLPFILLTSPIVALIQLLSSYVLCYRKYILARFLNTMAFSIVSIIFLIVEYDLFMIEHSNEFQTIRILFRSYLAVLLFLIIYVAISLPEILSNIKHGIKKEHINYKWITDAKLHAKNAMVFIFASNISVMMVGLLAFNSKSLAFYNISLLLAGFIGLIPTAIFRDLIPEINASMKNKDSQEKFGLKWRQYSALNFIYVLCLGIIIFSLSPQMLSLFGTKYITSEAIMLLKIIIIGKTIGCLFGYNQLLLCYTDHINALTKLYAITILIQIALAIPLSYAFDVQGIAIAFSISMIISEILVLYKTKQYIPFNIYFLNKKTRSQ